ncbi:Fc.00g036730.m01.CDS01 [Cosmosporella sp. VM-42]
MASTYSPTLVSVGVPRNCSLCQFDIEIGDEVVAGEATSPSFSDDLNNMKSVRDVGKQTPRFPYGSKLFKDRSTGAEYSQCNANCRRKFSYQHAVGYHVGCAALIPPHFREKTASITAHSFKPSPFLERQRDLWLRNNLTSEICGVLRRLPSELVGRIAHYCTREHATQVVQNIMSAQRPGEDSQVEVSGEGVSIWARFAEYVGKSYIASLANSLQDTSDKLIFKSNDDKGKKEFSDTQGINSFLPIVSKHHLPTSLRVFGAQLFLYPTRCHAHDFMEYSMTTPANYSDRGGVWFYLPISEGELIEYVWARLAVGPRASALLLKTNQDCVMTIGAHRTRDQPTKWKFLHRLQGSPERIFYHDGPNRIRAIQFESNSCHEQRPRGIRLPFPEPASPTPKFSIHEEYFYTFASLKDVTKVTPCRRSTNSNSTIIGLLLEYSTGRRACVGQIRTDSLDRAVTVQAEEKLWLSTQESSKGYSNVVTCDVGVLPPDWKGLTFVEAAWEGKLEWWFSSKQSQVCYCS